MTTMKVKKDSFIGDIGYWSTGDIYVCATKAVGGGYTVCGHIGKEFFPVLHIRDIKDVRAFAHMTIRLGTALGKGVKV